MKKAIIIFLIFTTIATITGISYGKDIPFTQEDRDRIIRLETKLEQMEKRFEQRFDQVDKRFSDMFNFLWILTGIFTAIMVGNMGFAFWDRRTIIRKAKEEAIAEIEKEGRLKDLINSFRELSKKDQEVAKVLKQFNLL